MGICLATLLFGWVISQQPREINRWFQSVWLKGVNCHYNGTSIATKHNRTHDVNSITHTRKSNIKE